MQAIELRSRTDSYKNSEPETMEQRGSQGMKSNTNDGWIEVKKPMPQPEVAKYIPKLPYSQRQQRIKLNQRFKDF